MLTFSLRHIMLLPPLSDAALRNRRMCRWWGHKGLVPLVADAPPSNTGTPRRLGIRVPMPITALFPFHISPPSTSAPTPSPIFLPHTPLQLCSSSTFSSRPPPLLLILPLLLLHPLPLHLCSSYSHSSSPSHFGSMNPLALDPFVLVIILGVCMRLYKRLHPSVSCSPYCFKVFNSTPHEPQLLNGASTLQCHGTQHFKEF
jgi:hypothetical protein